MSLLSVPVLVVLGWWIAGLLWWDSRRRVISPAQRPWTAAGFGLLALAMVIAIAAVPARPLEQMVRVAILIESGYGIVYLVRSRGARRGP